MHSDPLIGGFFILKNGQEDEWTDDDGHFFALLLPFLPSLGFKYRGSFFPLSKKLLENKERERAIVPRKVLLLSLAPFSSAEHWSVLLNVSWPGSLKKQYSKKVVGALLLSVSAASLINTLFSIDWLLRAKNPFRKEKFPIFACYKWWHFSQK